MSEPLVNVALPKLREVLRDSPGLSQRGLAAALGIHESNVSRLINGGRQMLSREQIEIIEQYTGREYAYLAELKSQNLTESEAEHLRKFRAASEKARQLSDDILDAVP
ncbi:MAG: helix-turn-helix transcriptional regulator [Bradyrhizobium sp.]|nr:helix-turn-helix transcriptional regulator [Bradyrhizobium sp.]